jgi:hypothetical protein
VVGALALSKKGAGGEQGPGPDPAARRADSRPEKSVEDKVLQDHLRLAEARKPAERFQALDGMAAHLRAETLRQARREAVDQVAYLVWLHRRVVGEGLLPTAGRLPADGRPLLGPVIAELRRAEGEVRQLLGAVVPKVAAPLRMLAATAHEAAAALQADPAKARLAGPAPEPPAEVPSRSLLRVLVVESLQVVAEDDPVKRADHSTRVVDSLAREIVARAETAAPEETARLGETLGELVDRAVDGNLDEVDPAQADVGRQEAAEQVRRRADAAMAELRQKLAQMPQAARQNLERALQQQRPPKKPFPWKGKPRGGHHKGRGHH